MRLVLDVRLIGGWCLRGGELRRGDLRGGHVAVVAVPPFGFFEQEPDAGAPNEHVEEAENLQWRR